MTVSLRLDEELAEKLDAAAIVAGVSKSEYIRQCLQDRLNTEGESQPTAWELGQDLFGCSESGKGDLSVRAKEIVRERIQKKHAKRRGRQRTVGRDD